MLNSHRYPWTAIVRIPIWAGVVVLLLTLSFGFTSARTITSSNNPQAFPGMISYQGLVEINGQHYSGTGYFKFAIVGVPTGMGTNYWANDGIGSGEPNSSVMIPVNKGLFSINLGDTNLMSTEISPIVFNNNPTYLRVWFSSSPSGPYQALEPNQRIVSVGYAMNANLLDGQGSSYYLNATNINSGALGLTYFSAYSDLQAESKIGDGSMQIASGDHGHMGQTWTKSASDGLNIVVENQSGYALKAESYGDNAVGVWAIVGKGAASYAIHGESNAVSGIGVYGVSNSNSGAGVVAEATALGSGLEAYSYAGNIIEGWDGEYGSSPELRFKVENDGDVFADGYYYGAGGLLSGNSDLAEMLPAGQNDLEPGDVLAIGYDGKIVRSSKANQTSVVGVYSTEPGFVGGASWIEEWQDEGEEKIPLAIVGVVPVRASAENGAITPGDLLVSASTAGHAMKAGESPAVGTVLGKALEALEDGTGLILMLVMLQ